MMRLWIVGRDIPLEFDSDELAESIIKSPTCVCKIEQMMPIGTRMSGVWTDITTNYYEQISARIEYWKNKEESERMKIKSTPKYSPGEVIDLSYKNGGLPNRIVITCAFWRRGDTQWVYKAFMESTGEYTVLDETFITSRASKKTSPIYNDPTIIKRISDGWRFCGNFENEVALANGKLIAENPAIKNVRLWPAMNYNGKFVKGQMGIWIVWNHIITDDGRYDEGSSTDTSGVVDIK